MPMMPFVGRLNTTLMDFVCVVYFEIRSRPREREKYVHDRFVNVEASEALHRKKMARWPPLGVAPYSNDDNTSLTYPLILHSLCLFDRFFVPFSATVDCSPFFLTYTLCSPEYVRIV